MHSFIVQLTSVAGEILAAGFNYHGVHFNKVDMANSAVTGKLLYNSSVACADYKNLLYILVNRHRDMDNHFVIYECVTLGKHYVAVEGQHPAELTAFKNIYALVIAVFGEKLTLYAKAELHIGSLLFAEP